MKVNIDKSLASKFEIILETSDVNGINVRPRSAELDEFRNTVVSEVKSNYTLESINLNSHNMHT